MKSRAKPWMIAISVFGVIALACVYWWDPKPEYRSAPNAAAAKIDSDELARAAGARVFFGHRSVGKDILAGVEKVFDARNATPPALLEFTVGETVPAPLDRGTILHAAIGRNGRPEEKLANFDSALRRGIASEVDVALLKFCYVDITADTDVDALFSAYQETLTALERDFPEVIFVHSTAPLTTGPAGLKDRVKILLGGDDNATRNRYNDLIRQAYDDGRLFDLAAVEATGPSGDRVGSLHEGYTSDGAHLNDSGSSLVAVEFLRVIAANASKTTK